MEFKNNDIDAIHFMVNERIVLELRPNGEIIWDSPNGLIAITDAKTLTLALFGLLVSITGDSYDYSKVDDGLWDEYVSFLKSKRYIIKDEDQLELF